MSIIDLIALLASIANDAAQTSSRADDQERISHNTHLCNGAACKVLAVVGFWLATLSRWVAVIISCKIIKR